MSEEKATHELVTLHDVYFVYSNLINPRKEYDFEKKTPESDMPLELHKWEISVLLDEKRFKALKKKFKGAPNITHATDLSAEEINEKFGLEVEDDMVQVKFTKPCVRSDKKGERVNDNPIRVVGQKGLLTDLKGTPVADHEGNMQGELGWGSFGKLQFMPAETKFGVVLYPRVVCVGDKVMPPEGTGAAEDDLDALGIEDLGEATDAELDALIDGDDAGTEVADGEDLF